MVKSSVVVTISDSEDESKIVLTTPPCDRKRKISRNDFTPSPPSGSTPWAPKKGAARDLSPLPPSITPEEAFDGKCDKSRVSLTVYKRRRMSLSNSKPFAGSTDDQNHAPRTPPLDVGSWKYVNKVGWVLTQSPFESLPPCAPAVVDEMQSTSVSVEFSMSQPRTPPMMPGVWMWHHGLGWVLERL